MPASARPSFFGPLRPETDNFSRRQNIGFVIEGRANLPDTIGGKRTFCIGTPPVELRATGTDHRMSNHCDVCVIEDDPSDRNLMQAFLARAEYDCVVAPDGECGWQLVHEHRPKVVVCDWVLPRQSGLEVCQRLRSTPELASTFFIMVTARENSQDRNTALESGVDDYLIKPLDRAVLLARVRVGIRMWEANERLRQAAITDGLTGLYNHDYLTTVIEREMNRSRRYGHRLSMIMLDLDFFKAINDTYGHMVGNDTLVDVARILRQSVREFDTVGRFGGEEFAIVTPEASQDDAVAISERIRRSVADTLNVPGLRGHQVTVSLGVASADDACVRSSADLLDLADRALYAAKHLGRDRVATPPDAGDCEPAVAVEQDEIEALRRHVAVLRTQAKQVYMQSVASLVQALEEKDPFTARHSHNVAYYGELLAQAAGLSESLIATVRNAGLLHDVGKVGIPDRILVKPTTLSEIETSVMRLVPGISVRILDHLRILDSEMHIIRHQREYFDGTGFPDGLCGAQIPIGSRIILVANAFDAMSTDRVYRACRSIDGALDELKRLAGSQFDPDVVAAFAEVLTTHQRDIRDRIRETAASLRTPAI